MAVKVTVYGTADMRQIERARGELNKLEQSARMNAGGFQGAMARLSASASKVGSQVTSLGSSMTRNLTLPLVAVGAGLYKATQAAAEDAQAQTVLANTLKNTAGATASAIAQTEAWITQQGKLLGVSDDQLRPALATLTTATKDIATAQGLASVAMDIAAQKGVPVEKAATALAKAYTGQYGQLQRLLPGIDAAAIKNKDFGAVMQNVNQIVGGQAAAAANTEAGARRRATVALSEATEELGTAFLPVMTQVTKFVTDQVVPAITRLTNWFKGLSEGQRNMILTTGLVLAVLGPLLSIVGRVITGISQLANGMAFMGKQAVAAYGGIQNLVTGMTNANAASSAFATPMTRLGGVIRSAATATWGFVTSLYASIAAGVRQTATWIANTAALVANRVATVAANVATKAYAAAQWLLNAALTANPIGLVIVAIGALIAIVVLIATHTKELGRTFSNVWNSITSYVGKAVNMIGSRLTAFITTMKNIAANMVSGFLNGFRDFGNKLMAAVAKPITDAINWVKNKLGIRSPSAVTHAIGENFGQGFVNGITAQTANARNAAAQVANAASNTLNDGLRDLFNVDRTGVVNELSSSGALKTYESFSGKLSDLADAVLGDASAFQRVRALVSDVITRNPDAIGADGVIVQNEMRQAAEDLMTEVTTLRNKFKAEGSENDRIAAALGQSTGNVGTKLTTAATKLAEKIKQGAKLAKDAMKAWSMDEVVKPLTTSFDQVLEAIQSQITATANFMNNLASLKGRLNQSALATILAMGAAQGGGIAAALASASDAQLAQYNMSYAEQERLTGSLGLVQAGATKIAPVTIAPGAVTVTIQGNADKQDVTMAIENALNQLTRDLRNR